MSVASCAILSNFFVEQWRSKPSTIPFRIVARFSKQLYNCKYLAQFLSLNIFEARTVRYVWVTCSVSSQTRAFRFSYVTIMNFSERVWGKESRTGTRQVYGIVHPVVYLEFHCRSELRVTNQHSLIPQDRIPTETQIFHTPQARDKDSSILASCFPREQIEKHSRPKQHLRAWLEPWVS